MVHCLNLGVQGYNSLKILLFFSLKIYYILANSTDPDGLTHSAAFYLGLDCLYNYPFRGIHFTKGNFL